MLIYPAMDLFAGEVVRLYKGDFQQKTVYYQNPHDPLTAWQKAGVERVHLVDLCAARGDKQDIPLMNDILSQYTMKIQVAGGVRSAEQLAELLSLGADRVVIGSLAVTHPELVHQLIATYSANKITLACDVMKSTDQGEPWQVKISGWQQKTDVLLDDLLKDFAVYSELVFLVTDIARDGTLTGISHGLYQYIQTQYPSVKFLVSGGVCDQKDIASARSLGAYGCIVGKSLYQGKLSIREIIGC